MARPFYIQAVALSLLVCFGISAPTAFAGEAQNTDIVFLVDSSGGIIRADAANSRDYIIEAVATMWAGIAGDRIAVGLYSGWNESTANLDSLVRFELTELPESKKARRDIAFEISAALSKAPPKAIASDINAALQVVLPKILQGKTEDNRKTWVIIITDGDMNVIEGSKVRKEYIDASAASFGKVDPDTLPKAATNILFNETLPELQKKNISVTLLGVGTKPNRPGYVFARGADKFKSVVINERGQPLSAALKELLGSASASAGERSFTYGKTSREVAAGEEIEIPFLQYAGTKELRISIFGSHGNFSTSLTDAPSSKPFRIIDIENITPGSHVLTIKNNGAEQLAVTFSIDATVDFALNIKWPDEIAEHLLNTPINVSATLVNAEGAAITDEAVLGSVSCGFEVDATSLGETAIGDYSIVTDSIEVGTTNVVAKIKAFKLNDEYLYTGPAVSKEIRFMPGYEVNFARTEALLAQDVAITAVVKREPSSLSDTLTVKVEPDGEIILGADGENLSATETYNSVGTRTITRQIIDDYLIVGGDSSTLKVREMTINILSGTPPHAPLTELRFDLPFAAVVETDVAALDVVVAFDFDKSADNQNVTATVVHKFIANAVVTDAKRAGDISFKIETDGVIASNGHLKVRIIPSVSNKEFLPNGKEGFLGKLPWPEVNMGSMQLDCNITGMDVSNSVPLVFAYSDFWAKAAKLYAMYWIPALLVLLLLILFILSLLFKARFVLQQLRVADTLAEPTGAVYKLENLSESSAKRKAIGTPEVSDSVSFRITGSRLFGKGRVSARPMTDECKVEVQGSAITVWTKLQHGDSIRVENVDGQSCDYFYFAHEPTEEELQALSNAGKVLLGPDEFIIEGLD